MNKQSKTRNNMDRNAECVDLKTESDEIRPPMEEDITVEAVVCVDDKKNGTVEESEEKLPEIQVEEKPVATDDEDHTIIIIEELQEDGTGEEGIEDRQGRVREWGEIIDDFFLYGFLIGIPFGCGMVIIASELLL